MGWRQSAMIQAARIRYLYGQASLLEQALSRFKNAISIRSLIFWIIERIEEKYTYPNSARFFQGKHRCCGVCSVSERVAIGALPDAALICFRLVTGAWGDVAALRNGSRLGWILPHCDWTTGQPVKIYT